METAGADVGDKEFDLFGTRGTELSEASPSGTCWAWAARGLIYQQVPQAKNVECKYSSSPKGPFVERLVIWPRQMLNKNLTLIEVCFKSQVKTHVFYKVHFCYSLWTLKLPRLLELGPP